MAILARKLISSSENIAKPVISELFRLRFQHWVSMIGCGNNKDGGKKFAAVWGNGDYGRLGLGNLESQWSPRILDSSVFNNQNLREIACGGAHTLLLTENGSVYATGLNDFGQLGISDDKSYTTEPLLVHGLPKEVTRISAGYHHSSAVTVDGELYMWGKNSNGQLGLGKNKGEALSWGGAASGGLGHGHKSSILGFVKASSEFTPRLIKDLEGVKVKSVAAGVLHSACIDESGFVYIFGEREKEKLVVESCTHGAQTTMAALVSGQLMLLIHLKELKVLS